MTAETIGFATGEEAVAVFGSGGEELRAFNASFGIEASQRGLCLSLSGGDATARARAKDYVEGIIAAHRTGFPLSASVRERARALFAAGEGERWNELPRTRVATTASGRAVFPRTLGQLSLVRSLAQNGITLCAGPAGTGKTFLAVAAAVAALKRGEVARILLSRPAVEAGEALGFLPGDLTQKILPYLRPLHDALGVLASPQERDAWNAKGMIEIAPLAYMRGRTVEDAFMVLDEAQNATREQMLMFLTRLGRGSRMAVGGDLGQVDLDPRRVSGLREAMRRLGHVAGVGTVRLTSEDVVRHPLVERILRAWESGEDTRHA